MFNCSKRNIFSQVQNNSFSFQHMSNYTAIVLSNITPSLWKEFELQGFVPWDQFIKQAGFSQCKWMFALSTPQCIVVNCYSSMWEFNHFLSPYPAPFVSPISRELGHIPSPSTSICDRSDGRQRQWKELHRQAAGGLGCSSDWLWQTGPWCVPAGHSSLSQSAGSIWVRWGNTCGWRYAIHLLVICLFDDDAPLHFFSAFKDFSDIMRAL